MRPIGAWIPARSVPGLPHRAAGRLQLQAARFLPELRLAVGLTDEKHGHVRPGYTAEGLKQLLSPEFEMVEHHTYSRFLVEIFDMVVSLFFDRLNHGILLGRVLWSPPSI